MNSTDTIYIKEVRFYCNICNELMAVLHTQKGVSTVHSLICKECYDAK